MANKQLYRMHDETPNGVVETAVGDCANWNEQGFGIFWAVNSFDGPRRIENLARINAWAVDIDEGCKKAQLERLRQSPLVPSLVVETKRGFQVYWNANEEAEISTWNDIVLDRLVPYFGADKNARDLARIMRVPGFFHVKKMDQPFLVKEIQRLNVSYSQTSLLSRFPGPTRPSEEAEAIRVGKKESSLAGASGGLWERVASLDCLEALERLSGHAAVGGEHYTFKAQRSGNKNIYANNKSTSAWIDARGRIGSLSKGGPFIYQWLRWFNHSPVECIRVIKQIYPELNKL